MGANIGLTKMAEATPRIFYRQMVNAAQWRMYDIALARASSVLVNFQKEQKLLSYWEMEQLPLLIEYVYPLLHVLNMQIPIHTMGQEKVERYIDL